MNQALKTFLILISTREEDTVFFATLATKLRCTFIQIYDPETLRAVLTAYRNHLVVWNLENFEDVTAADPSRFFVFRELLKEKVAPARLVVVSRRPLSDYAALLKGGPPVQQHIFDRYSPTLMHLLSRLIAGNFYSVRLDLSSFFPDGAEGHKIIIKQSRHRKAAVEAMQTFFIKKGVTKRLARIVAQAADELLMNAIFNAPHSSSGQATRRYLARTADFRFGHQEQVELEILASDEYIGLCVSDQYGAFPRDTFVKLLQTTYRQEGFKTKSENSSSGLGVLGMLESGLSIFYLSKPKARTDAMLFFPVGSTYKKFREGFQFSVFLGGEPPAK